MIIFLSFLWYLFLTTGLSVYLSFRLENRIGGFSLWFIFFLFCFNSLFLLMLMENKTFKFSRIIVKGLSFLTGFALYFFLLVVLNDFLLIIPFYGRLFFSFQSYFWSAFFSISALIGFYAVWNAQRIELKSYSILNTKGVNCRLVFLSDLHISPNHVSNDRLIAVLRRIMSLNPDFVLLGGDIIEMAPDYFNEMNFGRLFQKELKNLPIIAVVGNHEYYGGRLRENMQALKESGIIVLKDSVFRAPEKKITFIGRDDHTNKHRQSLNALVQEQSLNRYLIVMDHDPASLPEAITSPVDLQLSGHTHNGQIFPFNFFVQYLFENAYGYKKLGHLDSIVSSGMGVWGPLLRLGTRSEIVLIDIVSVKS